MYFLVEATIALFVSFLINLFVVAVFGQAFYQQTNQAAVREPPALVPTPLGGLLLDCRPSSLCPPSTPSTSRQSSL